MVETLGSHDAHVWYLWPDQITDPAQLELHRQILSDEELVRNASFRFDEHRRDHLLTRAFVRTLLSRYSDVKPADWKFANGPYGKPEISGLPDAVPIAFNISHTAGLIACMFSRAPAVGIDVENLRHTVDYLNIARDHFSAAEFAALNELPESDRHVRFFEYWTLKESYLKACGLGISEDLAGFTFHIDPQKISIVFESSQTDSAAQWRFQLLRPGNRHIVATAIRCPENQDVRIEIHDGTGLMKQEQPPNP